MTTIFQIENHQIFYKPKRNTVVIKILPAVEREDVVESKVVYYDYDLRIRAFKKLYEQVMDASCLPCED